MKTKILCVGFLLCALQLRVPCLLAAGPDAESDIEGQNSSPTGELPAPLTIQERMQRSAARQLQSVTAMQRSVDLQRRLAQRQTGQSGGTGFFALPPAPPLASPLPVTAEQLGNSQQDQREDISAPPPVEELLLPDASASVNRPAVDRAAALKVALGFQSAGLGGLTGITGFGAQPLGTDIEADGTMLQQLAGTWLKPGSLLPSSTTNKGGTSATELLKSLGGFDSLYRIFQPGGSAGAALFPALAGIQ